LEFHDISRVSEAITGKRMEIDSYCQQHNYSPLMYFPAMYRLRWHRKAFLSCRASNHVEMAKTSLHTHTAVARLPGVS